MTQIRWSERQQLMGCLVLSEPLWRLFQPWVSEVLKAGQEEAGVKIWVRCVNFYFDSWGILPSPQEVSSLASEHISKLRDNDERLIVQRDGLAAIGYSQYWLDSGRLTPQMIEQTGRQLVASYLSDLVSKRYAERLAKVGFGGGQDELATELQNTLTRIRGTFSARFQSIFPNGYFTPIGEDALQPVGIDFVDAFCGGGLLNCEVVGHVAPIGQGKTTLISQLCHSRSSAILNKRIIESRNKGLEHFSYEGMPQVYFFAYEQVQNLLANYISNAATIPRDTSLKATMVSAANSPFSSREKKNWAEYERIRWKAAFDQAAKDEAAGKVARWPMGELERFQQCVKLIDAAVQIVDFSGHDESLRDWSERAVDGMRDYILAHQDAIGNPGVNFIAVDFVGAMIDQQIAAGRIKAVDRSDAIRTAPQVLGRELASKFNCPVWAAHQLNPSENKKAGGTMPDPKSADGSGAYLMYCSVGVASGMLTKDNVAVYVLGKQRRMRSAGADIFLGKLGGQFARWGRAEDFVFSEGSIMRKREKYETQMNVPGKAAKVPPSGGLYDKFVK